MRGPSCRELKISKWQIPFSDKFHVPFGLNVFPNESCDDLFSKMLQINIDGLMTDYLTRVYRKFRKVKETRSRSDAMNAACVLPTGGTELSESYCMIEDHFRR